MAKNTDDLNNLNNMFNFNSVAAVSSIVAEEKKYPLMLNKIHFKNLNHLEFQISELSHSKNR